MSNIMKYCNQVKKLEFERLKMEYDTFISSDNSIDSTVLVLPIKTIVQAFFRQLFTIIQKDTCKINCTVFPPFLDENVAVNYQALIDLTNSEVNGCRSLYTCLMALVSIKQKFLSN